MHAAICSLLPQKRRALPQGECPLWEGGLNRSTQQSYPEEERWSGQRFTAAEKAELWDSLSAGESLNKELADYQRFTLATNIDVYFCDPQSPWQRGSTRTPGVCCDSIFPRDPTRKRPTIQAREAALQSIDGSRAIQSKPVTRAARAISACFKYRWSAMRVIRSNRRGEQRTLTYTVLSDGHPRDDGHPRGSKSRQNWRPIFTAALMMVDFLSKK